ncbi:Thrombospondin type-1 domain-containing protein 4-like 2 [Homarus americanus]|uniref:Thrombospondin type-1 domain-containing protein 4-like 2 n=1 Tax=Homarus americanus TaxID=6706 RepID=A0A8J5JF81_HOMAM|nr:Thrombospondin type-1 domain-containing protein 4-like 2 [Homarus americanus]
MDFCFMMCLIVLLSLKTAKDKLAAAASLPKPEALQGGRSGHSLQAAKLGSHQSLQGLHLGRIPPSCALCSRERNLCRIISGIFTRSPLPYGYSLVTPVPAGVCNLTITEMKPSKNFFALRRSDGTYVLNGNWDIEAAGQYQAAGTTFLYTPSSDDHGEQLSAPGPLTQPIDFMYLGGAPSSGLTPPSGGLGTPSGGLRPNMGGGQLTPFQPLPQGNPNIGSRNPNFGIRNPGSVGVNPGGQSLYPYGTGNTGIPGGTFGPINPVLTPVAVGGEGGQVSFNSSGVLFSPINPQGSVGTSPSGSSRNNSPFLGVPLDPSTNVGSRGPAGIPGVPPHSQPITPLGSTTKTTGSLPLPWSPTYGLQDGGRGVPLGTPFLPGQQYPRAPGGGSVPSGVGQRYPGQGRSDGGGLDGGTHDREGASGVAPSRDIGFPPEFPKNSVPLRPIAIPRPGSPGGRRPPTGGVSGHHRRPPHEATTPATPTETHRTRHQHGAKLGQGRRKIPGKSPFDPGVQLTQPNVSPSSTTHNRTVPIRPPRRRGKGSRRRHQQQDGASGVLSGRKQNQEKDRKGRHRKRGSRFQWAEKGFTPCSRPCGGGNQTVILSCERKRNKKVVPDRRCGHLIPPETRTAMCNLTPCPAAWMPGEWGPCSVTCGMGVQTRPLVCKQVVSPILTMMVPEGACLSPSTVPTSQVCEIGRCSSTTPEWEAGPWSNCSAPCGLGTRKRLVTCVVGGVAVEEDLCTATTRPVKEQVCDMGSCATNTWFFSSWSDQCSESCGTGVQTRRVHCLAGGEVPESQCSASTKPDASRPCSGQSGCGGQWFIGPWEGCSVDCGSGRETRSVLCVMYSRQRWRVTQDSQCKLEIRPPDSRECNGQPCTPDWYTSEWSQPCHLHPCNASVTPPPGPGERLGSTGGSQETQTGGEMAAPSSEDLNKDDEDDDDDSITKRPVDKDDDGDEDDAFAASTDDDRTTHQQEEEGEEEEGEEENELVVEETTGSAINVIPDKDAQGDESISDDEDGEENDEDREEEEEEAKKKKKRKRKKDRKKNRERQHKTGSTGENNDKEDTPVAIDKPTCIDRIKNCHLVFRARLCRLKYYNKLCCRTCSNT